ncbi:MAG TPA: isocitrate/isopropylmalate dehydrogenase family protein [Candidatus Corynebacterium avicola]|uniref:Isocitrate/isopropylmalate dehydrogenase family protein n=1 Tax=Candidatus Corynebacterium avicola TaxID=2838527 RepID=A0A9D1RQ31_9CORY|nr:isocitrate/isopropylmalate dehydrogenase family protein [Candidatus Corynebacterium avicola]
MDKLNFAVLEGDGIGPEVTDATRKVLEAVLVELGVPYTIDSTLIGFPALEKQGTTFPPEALDLASGGDGIILGPVSHLDYPPVAEGGVNPSGALRRNLDLFANVRPAKTFDGVRYLSQGPFDLVIVRENTEGFYADRTMYQGTGEVMPTRDLAMAFRKVTREGSLRIARNAFELARQRRSHVTAVHKFNVLRTSDGLFLECVRQVREEFPDVEYREELVDAMAALLIRDASQFDVVVTTNMFGDILSDEATELSGSIGLAASLNSGKDHAMAQAQHGSAPSLAGLDKANPSSLIGSVAMLCEWLGIRKNLPELHAASDSIHHAIAEAVADPATRTGDLGGPLGTQAFTDVVTEKALAFLRSSK